MACKEKCGKTLVCGHRYWLLVNVLLTLSWTADRVFFDIGICEGGPAASHCKKHIMLCNCFSTCTVHLLLF